MQTVKDKESYLINGTVTTLYVIISYLCGVK